MKKKLRFSLFFLLLLLMEGSMQAQNAQKPFDIDLWQQGMPNTNGMDSAPFDESKGNSCFSSRTRIGHRSGNYCLSGR